MHNIDDGLDSNYADHYMTRLGNLNQGTFSLLEILIKQPPIHCLHGNKLLLLQSSICLFFK